MQKLKIHITFNNGSAREEVLPTAHIAFHSKPGFIQLYVDGENESIKWSDIKELLIKPL